MVPAFASLGAGLSADAPIPGTARPCAALRYTLRVIDMLSRCEKRNAALPAESCSLQDLYSANFFKKQTQHSNTPTTQPP
jgi:hypothetical protein